MSRARKAREAVIPRDEDFARWRKLVAKSVHPRRDFDKFGRKLWGHADETKRVYACSADHTLHIRSFVRLRPLLEHQRKCNGAEGELPAIECCADGRTMRFARDPSIPVDEEKRIQEVEGHGEGSPGHTASLYAYRCCCLYDHRTNQDQMFSGFVPQALNAVMYGGRGCLVVYGEKGSGKSYTLFGTDAEREYAEQPKQHKRVGGTVESHGEAPQEAAKEAEITGKRHGEKEAGHGGNISSSDSDAGRINVDVNCDGRQQQVNGHQHNKTTETQNATDPTNDSFNEEPEKDIVWLAEPDNGAETGIFQRAIHSIFDRCQQGKLERQSRYRVEMNIVMFTDGSDQEVSDLSSFDEQGRPKQLIVDWDPENSRFEAEGCNFVTYKRAADMVWATLRANWMRRKLDPSGEHTTVVYRIRVHLSGIGDPSWKDIVGDQLGEGQPAMGEFMVVEASGFSIGPGFPDPHTGKDGVFDSHETLRMLTKVLEYVKFNSLPALRKKHSVPYRMNPVTRLMSTHLKQGAIVTFLGCAGIDKKSHVGTLHTLWCASAVQRPRTHRLQLERAKTKLKVVAMLAGAGATWAARSEEEKDQRRTEAKAHVFAHATSHMEHILADKHKQRTGEDEWSSTHQTQLRRAQPRLERRASNRNAILMTSVSVPNVAEMCQNGQESKSMEGSSSLGDGGGEQEDYEQESLSYLSRSSSRVTNWIKSRDQKNGRVEGPRLKGFGGELDENKGFLSPYVQVLKMPEVQRVPPAPL